MFYELIGSYDKQKVHGLGNDKICLIIKIRQSKRIFTLKMKSELLCSGWASLGAEVLESLLHPISATAAPVAPFTYWLIDGKRRCRPCVY